MFEGFSISLNEDYSFVESNPIGNPNTGKWSVDGDILIRNYDMNIMLKQSIEMYNRIKPKQDTFDSINEYKNAMLEYQNKIDQLMKVLYLESKYMIINGILEIEVDSPGPEGKSIKIIFPLKRQK